MRISQSYFLYCLNFGFFPEVICQESLYNGQIMTLQGFLIDLSFRADRMNILMTFVSKVRRKIEDTFCETCSVFSGIICSSSIL